MDFLQQLLAMRQMLAPNPPDPSQGGGFIPDWSTGHPPSPRRPMPQLPAPLPAIQAPPAPISTPAKGGGDMSGMAPVDSGPMPTSASIPSMIQSPSRPPIKPTIPPSMGGPTPPPSRRALRQAAPAQPPAMDTTGPSMEGGPLEGLSGSDLTPTMDTPPLDASPVGGDVGGLPGQTPQMAISVPGGNTQGGGDLVSLIKRLLHKR